MRKKKGFTLIEIIICIAMLAIISVGSIVGINLVNKNLVKKGLEQITDKAIKATQVYIETNNVAQNQLYEKQNALYLPIKVLVNEGLLSLKGTNLSDKDIKNKYTITALSTPTGNEEDCVDINTKTSWDESKEIYICTYNKANDGKDGKDGSDGKDGKDGSNGNTTIINNLITINSNEYFAKGANPNNWVKFDDLYCKIAKGADSQHKCGYYGRETDYRGQEKSYFRILKIKNNLIEMIFMNTTDITPTIKYSKSTGGYYNSTNAFPTVCGENCASGKQINSSIQSSLFYVGNEKCFKKYEDVKRSNVIFGIASYVSVGNRDKASSRMLLYNEYINTFEEGVTWLPNSLYLGSFALESGNKNDIVYNYNGNNSYVYPIFRVILSDKVELVKEDCANSTTAGSVDCPYKINIKEDNYCGLAWE